jgi:hypothetical protein
MYIRRAFFCVLSVLLSLSSNFLFIFPIYLPFFLFLVSNVRLPSPLSGVRSLASAHCPALARSLRQLVPGVRSLPVYACRSVRSFLAFPRLAIARLSWCPFVQTFARPSPASARPGPPSPALTRPVIRSSSYEYLEPPSEENTSNESIIIITEPPSGGRRMTDGEGAGFMVGRKRSSGGFPCFLFLFGLSLSLPLCQSLLLFLSTGDRPGGGRGSCRVPLADCLRSEWTVNGNGLYIISS